MVFPGKLAASGWPRQAPIVTVGLAGVWHRVPGRLPPPRNRLDLEDLVRRQRLSVAAGLGRGRRGGAGAARLASGLRADGVDRWGRSSPGMLPGPTWDAGFGSVAAIGDLDRDGRPDLALAANRESAGSVRAAGSVAVLYGMAVGAPTARNQLWSLASERVPQPVHPVPRAGGRRASPDPG